MKDVRGKAVLITGGAMGMGKLWAQHFAQDGARLILWDVNEKALKETEGELKAEGCDVIVQTMDVTDREKVYKTVTELEKKYGNIDVLVNNAGIVAGGEFLNTPDEKLAATIDIDLKALMWTMKAVLPGMIKKGAGHIVNISSASGFVGVPFMLAYTASKWGVIGLTESIRLEMKELGHHGILFTCFCPSYVDTGMFKGARAPLLTKILKPEEVIDIAYDSFINDKYFVLEPWLVKVTPFLKGLLPTPIFDLISDVLGATGSMKHWTGHSK
ncbi:SDR family oxidoreductase [candidate division CSSED10-310 bacterium]|uniref:SDR family oxidoreductase n=1 Tax=candidate division CSSED10-310 bacterium TaxID=2855610 RepID=A0ABV6Z0V5_UNCC1